MTEDRVTVERELPDDAPLEPGEGADLLSIGLLVFFVALLVVVAALLALPVILG